MRPYIWITVFLIFLSHNGSCQNPEESVTIGRLGGGSLGEKNLGHIRTLHPLIQPVVIDAIGEVTDRGFHVEIRSSYRSLQESEKKLKKGNSGAPPGWSYHNYGLAFDLVPFIKNDSNWSVHTSKFKSSSGSVAWRAWWDGKRVLEEGVKEWEDEIVSAFREYGFTWGSAKHAVHLFYSPITERGADVAHFQAGIMLRIPNDPKDPNGRKVAVENSLFTKVEESKIFQRAGRRYPILTKAELAELGGQNGNNGKLINRVDAAAWGKQDSFGLLGAIGGKDGNFAPKYDGIDWECEKWIEHYRWVNKGVGHHFPKDQYTKQTAVNYITFHATETKCTHQDCLAKPQGMEQEIYQLGSGVASNHLPYGWVKPAYHYLIGNTGLIYKGREDMYAPASGTFYYPPEYFGVKPKPNYKSNGQIEQLESRKKNESTFNQRKVQRLTEWREYYKLNKGEPKKDPPPPHAPGASGGNITIAFITDFKTAPSYIARREAAKLAAFLLDRHGLEATDVRVHFELAQTGCPGPHIYNWLRKDGTKGLNGAGDGITWIEDYLKKIESGKRELSTVDRGNWKDFFIPVD